MIKELINLIKKYLNAEELIVPEGYKSITEEYNFYHFMEDYLLDNWDTTISDNIYNIIDELPELCAETEPYIDTIDMDIRLKEYYNELIKIVK